MRQGVDNARRRGIEPGQLAKQDKQRVGSGRIDEHRKRQAEERRDGGKEKGVGRRCDGPAGDGFG